MKITHIAATLGCSLLLACHSQKSPRLESAPSVGIVAGEEVAASDAVASSTVGFLFTGQDPETSQTPSLCSGTLIADDLVVTAAHCVLVFKTAHVVFARKFQNVPETQMRRIVKVLVHPKYLWNQPEGAASTESDEWNDLAVVRFEGSLPEGYRPAALIKDEALLKPGVEMTMAGFGLTSPDGADSQIFDKGVLRKAQVVLGTSNEIGPDLFFPVPSTGAAFCNGDSGGSVYLEVQGELKLAGVISRGKDSHCRDFSIATNLASQGKFLDRAFVSLRK